MIFSFEALRAQHGDCLLLHYGAPGDPRTVLIDGGPTAVYSETLEPRLCELREQLLALGCIEKGDALPLALMMVSHIDDDHIGGLLALAEKRNHGLEPAHSCWVKPTTLWHNTLDELAGDEGFSLGDPTPEREGRSDTAAVIASVAQGRRLQSRAEVLGWAINRPFPDGLVQAPAEGGQSVRLDESTSILVLSPRTEEIQGLRKEWKKQMELLSKGERISAKVAEYLDRSPSNLSSIVCLARQGERRILLTGDARGDLILKALDAAGVTSEGSLHVDILKIPHHGSLRGVDEDFFARITADHYVISANGRDGNPETETLELLARSRASDDFTIHLTYAAGKRDLGKRLQAFTAARDAKGRTFAIRLRSDPDLSLTVDLGDPPFAAMPTPSKRSKKKR